MTNPIASLFALLRSTDSQEGTIPRFWAVVLEADGEHALLVARNEKLPVRLEVPVHAGEKLLLEQGEMRDGRLQCRIIRRLAPQEQVPLLPDPVQVFIYPDAKQAFPYLLTLREQTQTHGEKQADPIWQFSLHTENLGIVALLVKRSGTSYSAVIVLETAAAVEKLMELTGRFSGEENQIVIEGIRVMSAVERARFCQTGSTLDSIR
jgi:hypothetical protein